MKEMLQAYGGALLGGGLVLFVSELNFSGILLFVIGGFMLAIAVYLHLTEKTKKEKEAQEQKIKKEAESKLYKLWPLLWEIDRNYYRQMLYRFNNPDDFKDFDLTLSEMALKMYNLGDITKELFDEIRNMHDKTNLHLTTIDNSKVAEDVIIKNLRPVVYKIDNMMKDLRNTAFKD